MERVGRRLRPGDRQWREEHDEETQAEEPVEVLLHSATAHRVNRRAMQGFRGSSVTAALATTPNADRPVFAYRLTGRCAETDPSAST